MARISKTAIERTITQCSNSRKRVSKWASDIAAMTANPRGGDAMIVSHLSSARRDYDAALDLLASAQDSMEQAAKIVNARKRK